MGRKLPIGIQDFEGLRNDGYVYVDKTEYIYHLVHEGKPYFLSRPRRFGKSLLLSVMKAYWEGKKELFFNLAIEKLEEGNPEAWKKYPVFCFDFNGVNYQKEGALEESLSVQLRRWERLYGCKGKDEALGERFQNLLIAAREQTGLRCVILVDEYDKPLLDVVENPELQEYNKETFKGFFSTLKSFDQYLRFVFITGVSKFHKVSIFSDLNQLRDISLSAEYAQICGITETEIKENFAPEIQIMSTALGIEEDECLSKLKKMYDGYHFHQGAMGVYNPFSLLNALVEKEFGMYWFSTGTPTFLIDKLKESGFDAKQITKGELYANANVLTDYRYDNPNPVPLFYQTGYLTIKGYDKKYMSYQLDYPNDEVRYGFLNSLAPTYLQNEDSYNPLDIRSFGMDIEKGRTDSLRDRFTELFARLPYPNDEKIVEQNFQNVVYIVFMLLGQYTAAEVHSAKGRADCIVETDDYVYVFEFKRDSTAEEAIKQIEDMGYANTYAADSRTLIKIGANFDSKERNLDGWKVVLE